MMRGGGLLVLLAVMTLWLHSGRGPSFAVAEAPTAFAVAGPQEVTIALGEGFPAPGVYHFSDALAIGDVIRLTGLVLAEREEVRALARQPLKAGEVYSLTLSSGQVDGIAKKDLGAQQRLLLAIPLHPDRMSTADWETLPGIGPKLAAAIVCDRQINGDFGSLDNLRRVKGIGAKRLAAWRPFFGAADPSD